MKVAWSIIKVIAASSIATLKGPSVLPDGQSTTRGPNLCADGIAEVFFAKLVSLPGTDPMEMKNLTTKIGSVDLVRLYGLSKMKLTHGATAWVDDNGHIGLSCTIVDPDQAYVMAKDKYLTWNNEIKIKLRDLQFVVFAEINSITNVVRLNDIVIKNLRALEVKTDGPLEWIAAQIESQIQSDRGRLIKVFRKLVLAVLNRTPWRIDLPCLPSS